MKYAVRLCGYKENKACCAKARESQFNPIHHAADAPIAEQETTSTVRAVNS
jgi:hypothetical protein